MIYDIIHDLKCTLFAYPKGFLNQIHIQYQKQNN